MCPGIRFPVIAIIVESRALVFMPHQLTDFVDVDFTGVYQCADVGLADFVHGLHRGHGMAAVFLYPAARRSGMDAPCLFFKIYGSEGTMTTEEAIENGTITEEENENLDDIFANW